MPRKLKSVVAAKTPRRVLKDIARQAGCTLGSLGDIEQLAGVNIQSDVERGELWGKFRHLFHGPTQELIDAVMNHCSAIVLRRIQAGELSLIKTVYY